MSAPTLEERLKEAARRHGKPWKCGPEGHAREVFVGRERRYVVRTAQPAATVVDIRRGHDPINLGGIGG